MDFSVWIVGGDVEKGFLCNWRCHLYIDLKQREDCLLRGRHYFYRIDIRVESNIFFDLCPDHNCLDHFEIVYSESRIGILLGFLENGMEENKYKNSSSR